MHDTRDWNGYLRIGSQPVFALAAVSPSLEFNFDDVLAKDYCKSETGRN
jgi:hypothetical protein